VDVQFEREVGAPVTLAAIKADPAFKDLALVRQGRLSVVPVSPPQWERLAALARIS
jgi:predicted RNA-binding protein with PUA-like domain